MGSSNFGHDGLRRRLAGRWSLAKADYVLGAEELTDGNMEAGGVLSWPIVFTPNAVITKEAASPYQGLQSLRVLAVAPDTEGFAGQITLSTGRLYSYSGAARGNTVVGPVVTTGGSGLIFSGTASSSWQTFLNVWSNAINIRVLLAVSGAGNHAEFDALTAREVLALNRPDLGVTANHGHLIDVTQIAWGTDKDGSGDGAIDFDGANTRVEVDAGLIADNAVTVCGWFNADGLGEGSVGTLIDDGAFRVRLAAGSATIRLAVTSDDGTNTILSADDALAASAWIFFAVTRKADGSVSIYLGTTASAPALSGAADQASGTPSAAPTQVAIGDKLAEGAAFDGRIQNVTVHQRILSAWEIQKIHAGSLSE